MKRTGAAVLTLLCVASWAQADEPLDGAVKIGDQGIAGSAVRAALDFCKEDAPQMPALDCLQAYAVRRWLLNAYAQTEGLEKRPAFAFKKGEILHRELIRELYDKHSSPDAAAVDEYLSQHQRDFKKPLRIRIFRIIVASEDEAKKVRKELGDNVNLEAFRKATRAYSVDKATHERGGDLGFVWPNGSTDIPQVSADPALYQAALALQDGQLSDQPVAEGKRFAVIWRRGSLPAIEPNEEARKIAALRVREGRADAELKELLGGLKKKHASVRETAILGKLRRPEATLFKEQR